MIISVTGVAEIRHAVTGKVFIIEPEELEWETDGGEDRQMGPEATHTALVDHPELGQLVWQLWEYPLGAENDRDVDVGPHDLIRNFSIGLSPDIDLEDFDHGDDEITEDRESRIEELVTWFHQHYEDPARRTPYESAEGGYQWIWGGPYDAREALTENFPDESDDIIEEAVEQIQKDGIFDWAPVEQPGDYDEYDDEEEGGVSDNEATKLAPSTRGQPFAGTVGFVPAPIPGPIFGWDQQGRIEMLSWTTSPTALRSDLFEELREACMSAIEQLTGTNAHGDLLASAERYQQALISEPISIERLYARGVMLDSSIQRIQAEVRADDRPPLPGGVQQSVAALSELHAAFIMATPEGRELAEGAAQYRRTPDSQAALDEAVLEIVKGIRQGTELFTEPVRELVAELGEQMQSAVQPERVNQVRRNILGNLIGTVAFAGTAVGMTVLGDGVAAAPIGQTLLDAVTMTATVVPQFIAANASALKIFAALAAPEMGWLSRLVDMVLRAQLIRQA